MPSTPATDPFEFANRVGVELQQLLGARARAELLGLSMNDQFSAALGAALLCVAEVLRDPIERGMSREPLIAICGRQLDGLLAGVQTRRQRPEAG